jgi:hypothetical protein
MSSYGRLGKIDRVKARDGIGQMEGFALAEDGNTRTKASILGDDKIRVNLT